jgi:hypothetical protein
MAKGVSPVLSTNEDSPQKQASDWLPPPKPSGRRSFPLSFRIFFWLIIVAILPLAIALVMNYTQTRPTLVNQANTTLETDTRTHTQLIDGYIAAKMLSLKSLDYTPIVQQYLLDPPHGQSLLPTIIANGEAIQKTINPDIMLVTFFTPDGKQLFSYSVYGLKPAPHGKYMISPDEIHKAALGQQFTSGIYYDPKTHISTTEIFTPVYSTQFKRLLGIVRETFNLQQIWKIVSSEQGANGSGSYAFILDQNGVRIVDPDSAALFTSIGPLSSTAQQQVQDRNLYGASDTVRELADTTLQSIQSQSAPPNTFQEVPVNSNQTFEVSRQTLTTVPWTYFVLTPLNVIEAVADQQLFTFVLLAISVLVLAAVIGWLVGNGISSPIFRSVETLVGSSSSLTRLAEREKSAASEQLWVVDSLKVGLHSVQYYTRASKIAAQRLNSVGMQALRQGERDPAALTRTIEMMVSIGQYFEKAIAYQEESNQKVEIAIKVTNEVSEQLADGAKSTREASNELDQVVNRLRQIVGN